MIRSDASPTPPLQSGIAQARAGTTLRGDAIDHWLGMFTRFLRLPHEQSRAISDELDSHMRERVRDLMLEGFSEDEGMRRAIDELGEAADLADHFRAAHRPNRRLAMSIAAFGVAAGAAVVSIVALSQSGQPPANPENPTIKMANARRVQPQMADIVLSQPVMLDDLPIKPTMMDAPVLKGENLLSDIETATISRVHQAPAAGQQRGVLFQPRFGTSGLSEVAPWSEALKKVRVTARGGTTPEAVLQEVAKQAGMKLVVSDGMGHEGGDIDQPLEVDLVDADIRQVLVAINQAKPGDNPGRIDLRERSGTLVAQEVGSLDRAESSLAVYDIADACRGGLEGKEIAKAIMAFVETDGWIDNGGSTGRMMVVGNKMFIEAPPRFHEGASWILTQFSGKAGVPSPAPAASSGFDSIPTRHAGAAPIAAFVPVAAQAAQPAAEALFGRVVTESKGHAVTVEDGSASPFAPAAGR